MDTRAARRTAEKAARDLTTSRAALIGDLGVAQAERTQLDLDVTIAADRGQQLVTAAQADAARLLEVAHTQVRDADQRYADLYSAATTGGLTPADLTALGFPPTNNPRRRRPDTAPPPASSTDDERH